MLRVPALDPLPCWQVEVVDYHVFVRERLPSPQAGSIADPSHPAASAQAITIIGGGAAGLAAAATLRSEGYQGSLTLLSADDYPPCDRPNLSKDYLAGTASEDWLPLRPAKYYRNNGIDLRLQTPVLALDVATKTVKTRQGDSLHHDALLLATGAERDCIARYQLDGRLLAVASIGRDLENLQLERVLEQGAVVPPALRSWRCSMDLFRRSSLATPRVHGDARLQLIRGLAIAPKRKLIPAQENAGLWHVAALEQGPAAGEHDTPYGTAESAACQVTVFKVDATIAS